MRGVVGAPAREGRGLGRVPARQRAKSFSMRLTMRPMRPQTRTSMAVRARTRSAWAGFTLLSAEELATAARRPARMVEKRVAMVGICVNIIH